MLNGFQNLNPKRSLCALVVLTTLGIISNIYSLPLFFGVEFIFGSIASLLVISTLGFEWGMLSTLVISAYTVYSWHHPYALIVLLGESLFVGIFLKKFRLNLALAVGVYWIFIGMPLIAVLYHYGLDLDRSGYTLAALKQGTNGIFNAIIASLILSHTPFLQMLGIKRERRIPVFQNIFNLFVAAALIPSLILVVLDARSALTQIENSASSRLETITTAISLSVERWLGQHANAMVSMGHLAEKFEFENHATLQKLVANNQYVGPDYLGSFITDKNGKTIAFYPTLNSKGISTIGIDFSDREYFQYLAQGGQSPYISSVFMARGGAFEPVFNIASAITVKGRFAGIASGSVNLKKVAEVLHYIPGKTGFMATLLDRNGHVIVSDNPNYKTLSKYDPALDGVVENSGSGFYYHRPSPRNQSTIRNWADSRLGMRSEIPGPSGWQLIVEMPMSPMLKVLSERYIQSMTFVLSLVLIILMVSIWIASRISIPLSQLSEASTNLPGRLDFVDSLKWPSSYFTEINTLVENFKSTTSELKKRFLDLQNSQDQLKRAKEEAETANRLKSSFLANMSHEIRTPLGIMIGFAELLSDENLDSHERKHFIETLQKNGEQLSVLINDILDLSKVEAGHLSVENIPFSLRELLDETMVTFKQRTERKKLNLVLDMAPGLQDEIVSDPVRLKQILWNLVGNAIKFTEHGEVRIHVLRNDQILEIDIKDSGIGIDQAHQEKLFKPFSQVDESMTRRFGGTGLGLALSKRLATLLGGELTLKSSLPEEGSVFSFRVKNNFVVAPKLNSRDESRTAQPEIETRALEGLKLLLVEDSVDNQFLIQRVLSKKGVSIDIADNGQAGVNKALAGQYDVVIMDLQMPIMDGYAATELLRRSGFNKPIIALTAHAMNEIKDRCFEVGCTDHLPKPINSQQIISTLAKYAPPHEL